MSPKITVVGVGGAGGNAVNNMISSGLEGCEFLVSNTDAQALEFSLCETRVQLGTHVTGGLGAGAKPDMGSKAAEESIEDVMEHLHGSNMVFITAGMGGGTGTGAAPIIARACRDAGILTVGVVTKPFHFEGTHRMRQAEAGILQMQDFVDTLIVIPNQNLFRVANERTTFAEAFRMADSVLQSGIRSITDLIIKEGLINLDFSDLKSAMLEMGKAMMGTGEAEGERRAIEAAEAAINNPLLDDISMKGARGVIINVTGGADMTLFEVDEACNRIRDEVDPNANIIFGSTFDDKMEGKMRVSVVATGIDAGEAKQGGSANGGIRVTAAGKPVSLPEAKPVARPQVAQTVAMQGAPMRAAIPTKPGAIAHPATQGAKPYAQDEPERDMFEQQEFTPPAQDVSVGQAAYQQSYRGGYAVSQSAPQPMAQQQTTGMRGTLHDGHFIPPKPMMPEPQDAPAAFMTGYGAVQQQAATTYQSAPMPMAQEQAYAQRPQQPQAERKKSPSLFERITSGVRRDPAPQQPQMPEEGYRDEAPVQHQANAGGFHSALRATPRPSESPAQGQLNIDAPAASRVKNEEELDIPAFLRRQAS